MISAPATAYDQVRYPGKFYPQASPERLATLATVYGLAPPEVQHCRVLELGCGEGGNLIPLAYTFPESTFVGVDLSQTAVEHGGVLIGKLGLKNVELRVLDLMDFPADAGTFDYIIAHGVLSWVPEAVRQQMLEICARHLAPKGVAYISYNTLPGGYLRSYARDLMRFHTRMISEPTAKTREARNVIDFVVSAITAPTLEREMLKREMKPYEGRDFFLYHDLLAEVNDPIYFLDFMDAASRCALQFVCEANWQTSRTAHLPAAVRQQLDALPDRLSREQYLDFIHGRRFRQTVLCRAGHDLDLEVSPERMERLLISSAVKPSQPIADLKNPEAVHFQAAGGPPFQSSEPVAKAIWLALGSAYPRGMRFSELRREVCRALDMDESTLPIATAGKMIGEVISGFANNVAQLHVHEFTRAGSVSDRPTASPLARAQAERDTTAVSLDLRSVPLEQPLLRNLVMLLDGTRDFEGLLLDLRTRVGGEISPENLRKALEMLAANGLLVQ